MKKINFKITPVQPFISSSRSISEYHASSLILSMISYWTMRFLLSYNNSSHSLVYQIVGRQWLTTQCIDTLFNLRIKTGNLGFPNKFSFIDYSNNINLYNLSNDIKDYISQELEKLLTCMSSEISSEIKNQNKEYKYSLICKKNTNINVNYTTQDIIQDIIKKMKEVFMHYFHFSLAEEGDISKLFDKHNDIKQNYYQNTHNSNSYYFVKCDLFEQYEAIWEKSGTKTTSTIENVSYLSMLKKVFLRVVFGKNYENIIDKEHTSFLNDREDESNYLALTVMDGDKMGEFISSQLLDKKNLKEEHNFFIRLNNFFDNFIFAPQNSVTSIINQIVNNNDKRGRLIYAGGDDIIFLSSCEESWKLNKEIKELFNSCFNKEFKDIMLKNKPSISSSVLLYKNKTPFSRLNKIAHNVLDSHSKSNLGRDAITFYLIKNNTEYGWGSKWDHLINNSLFDNILQYFENKNISKSFFYKIQSVLLSYAEVVGGDSGNNTFIEQQKFKISKNDHPILETLIKGQIFEEIRVNDLTKKTQQEIFSDIINLIKVEKNFEVEYDLFSLRIIDFLFNVSGVDK